MVDGHNVLTVINYATKEEVEGKEPLENNENPTYVRTRVTFSPGHINFIIAGDSTYSIVEGRDLRRTNVIMVDGANVEVLISEIDLLMLESTIGAFFLNQE
jgi:hypothetical protein